MLSQLLLPPAPGETFLFVELSLVSNMTITDCLILLRERGYNPELRFEPVLQENGSITVRLFALLREGVCSTDLVGTSPYLDDWEKLSELIEPNMAVRCPRGLPKQSLVTA
jgi:hypothetical protein